MISIIYCEEFSATLPWLFSDFMVVQPQILMSGGEKTVFLSYIFLLLHNVVFRSGQSAFLHPPVAFVGMHN